MVIGITLEQQQYENIETSEKCNRKILKAVEIKNHKITYAPLDCRLRQLKLGRCIKLYGIIIKDAELTRNN